MRLVRVATRQAPAPVCHPGGRPSRAAEVPLQLHPGRVCRSHPAGREVSAYGGRVDVTRPKPVWKRWWMIALYVLAALWLAQFVLFSPPSEGTGSRPAVPAPATTAVAPSDVFAGAP